MKRSHRRQFLRLACGVVALAGMPDIARAQARLPKNGTRLITLGTLGGPNPRAHQAQSANLLIVNGIMYLIDAGDGTARRLGKGNFRIRDIGIAFLTHLHDDHTSGLGPLMSVAWDQNRTEPIHVYGPPKTEELVRAAQQYFGISAEIRIADGGRSVPLEKIFVGHDIGTGLIYQDANVKVTAVENSHFSFHKGAAAGRHKSYSYRFETPDRVVVFTGDTGASDAVTDLARGADLLVTETASFEDRLKLLKSIGQWDAMTAEERAGTERQAMQGHMGSELIGQLATRANVKTVVLTHFSYRPSGDYASRADEVKRHFTGQVLVAKDLMEF